MVKMRFLLIISIVKIGSFLAILKIGAFFYAYFALIILECALFK